MMEINNIESALQKCIRIIQAHNAELDKDGSRFNIFEILGIRSSEVRLHSNFIAELLKIDGTHGEKNKFFIAFLNTLKESKIPIEFDDKKYKVEVEKTAGSITDDYDDGGRIDLIIEDSADRRIIIENKIYAGDQKKQLLRYHKFDPNALLLYLTLDGKEPSQWSTSSKEIMLANGKDYHCISYKDFINKWLEKCEETLAGANKPKVKETISQYKQTIDNLTKNSNRQKMIEKLADIVAENKDLYEVINKGTLSEAYQLFRRRIQDKFWSTIRIEIPDGSEVGKIENYKLQCKVDEDEEDNFNFFYGFYATAEDGDRINGNSEELKNYADKLKGSNTPFVFSTTDSYLAWSYSKHVKRVINIPDIFELKGDEEMKKLTDKLVQEFSDLKNELLQILNI